MMNLRKLISLVAICATSALFTGCGGDDTESGGGNNNGSAPQALNGRTYNLTDQSGAGTIAFDAAANTYTLTRGNQVQTGSFQANRSGDVWTVTTTDSTGTTTSTLTLTYTAAGSGTYVYDRPGEDPQVTNGSFSQASSSTTGTSTSTGTDTGTSTSTGTDTGTSTSTGTDTGTSTSTGTDTGTSTSTGTTTGTGTVQSPAQLSTITVTTGPTANSPNTVYTVTFNGGATGTFNAVNPEGNPMGGGTYTYTRNGTEANLRLVYPEANNEYDDMTLIFTQQPGSNQPNSFTGTQLVGGTVYPFSGTFTY